MCAAATFDAKADVWVYVDPQGQSHFSGEQTDERYTLFFRASIRGLSPGADAAALPASTPQGPDTSPELSPKLAAFFDNSPRYRKAQPLLQEAARKYRLDYELLKALVTTESGFEPAAVSPKGAIGLMQIMPDTARRFGVDSDRWMSVEAKLADPKINVGIGARYLRLLLDMFPGRTDLALASYNAGEGAVQRAGNKVPNYKETQNYVATVSELYAALKPPAPAKPAAPQKAGGKPVLNAYGDGYLLSGSRTAYVLAPGAMPGGAIGRGNMITPALPVSQQETQIAVD
ncbi:MAG: lytic transglycosylase domain-containing protein [Rhodoferax sp.]|uniref:lytic transglycosylase domain-containing protein n=1 Tax=Rhodoferax sp. TaxID=50421 RepID=UPI002ACD9396|nr:lytic transglycosylase domain-containing protein [Rhodoferax sp.]MDZ7892820.1 lytic transglycosylase domain-containing protein [Rhodoferax sp.]